MKIKTVIIITEYLTKLSLSKSVISVRHFLMTFPAHSRARPLIQFHNHFYTVGRTPWRGDQPVAMPLPTHRISAHRYPCLRVGFEAMIPAFERAKTVDALYRVTTVIGIHKITKEIFGTKPFPFPTLTTVVLFCLWILAHVVLLDHRICLVCLE
jgi:hypothetical protein